MALFDLPKRTTKSNDMRIAKKSNAKGTSTTPTIKGGSSLVDRIATIKAMVEKYLGKYKDDYLIIQDEQVLADYIDRCIDNCVISIDTETDGLDPILNHIAGICIYTPNEKPAYIPINHISYITQMPVPNQLSVETIQQQFERIIEANIDVIMFNAKFDIRVLRNQVGLKDIYCTWDCYLAAKLMNENEESHALKKLHQKYVLDGKEDAFKFDEFFNGIPFTYIPINVGYLYAAHDAIITYELYEYQKQYLYYDSTTTPDDRNGMNGVAWVFFNIEMPCVPVVCDMEDNGVLFDVEYAHELSIKYNKLRQDTLDNFYNTLQMYKDDIDNYKKKNPNHKLDDPINIGSPVQLSILFYDVLQVGVIDKKTPRGTGEAILEKMDNPLAKLILDYRGLDKLIGTYIDKLPDCVNPNDGRIHCSFNQYGAKTGRMSSSEPNLQNIPSKNHDIRKMFIATQEEKVITTETQQFVVDRWCEVECADEWKYADKIIVGDELLLDDGSCVDVCGVSVNQDNVVIEFRG